MILLITLVCLIALLGCLLTTPLELIIHSTNDEYKLRWGRLFKARLISLPDDLIIRVDVPFYQKDFFPLHPKAPRQSAQKQKPGRHKNTSKNSRKTLKRARAILRSFHIRQFRLNIDTDNYLINAYLYPIFYFFNRGKENWQINYNGQFELDLEMDNRPIRLIYALIKGSTDWRSPLS